MGIEVNNKTKTYLPQIGEVSLVFGFPPIKETLKPIFKELPGWNCSTADCRRLEDLPSTAMDYLRFLAELMEVPIAIVSLGASRDQTIVVEDPIHGPKRALLNY